MKSLNKHKGEESKEIREEKKEKKKKSWLRRNLSTIIVSIMMLVGLGLLIYPSFSDYWNSFHQTRAIMSYTEEVANIDRTELDKLLTLAKLYNYEIGQNGINWRLSDEEKEEYNSLLNFSGYGNMGYITIDKIKVTLPIYHGTSESVLQTSIGHLEGTSLPVGAYSYDYEEGRVTDENDGSHCVLSGHRGLPSARLFTDLDKLVEGDIFTLNILGETFTYQVDQIRIVEPSDLSELVIEGGKDYCTLVTCTPYGINTHRLLVRGHRVANPQGDIAVVADAILIESIYVAPFIGAPIILILIVWVFIETGVNRRRARVVREIEIEERREEK